MSFYKKVLVVKQLEKGYSSNERQMSGIARIERENGVCEFFLSVINLSAVKHGEYFAFVLDGSGKLFDFSLGSHPDFLAKPFPSPINTENFSVGIVFVDCYIPITVAFATTYSLENALVNFKKSVADFLANKHRADRKKEQTEKPDENEPYEQSFPNPSPIKPPYPPAPEPNPTITPPDEFSLGQKEFNAYNDEAVATENYFDFDDVKDKLSKIKELDDEKLRLENELPYSRGKEKAQESQADGHSAYDETDKNEGEEFSKKSPYYLTVEGELEEIFDKFPEEKELKKTFFNSRFAKVFYSDTKYYVVGVIKENDQLKYICYGVPATYSKEPPKELKGYCSFIPLSIFSLLGDGYWMMFQDAITGKCVKPK